LAPHEEGQMRGIRRMNYTSLTQATTASLPFSPCNGGLSIDTYMAIKRFIIDEGDRAFSSQMLERSNIKASADITTATDVAIEKSFSALIKQSFPTHGFVGEEDLASNRLSEYSWFIDPIDGTHYFASGVPLWSIAIALVHNDEPVLALIYNPSTGDLFEAQRGSGVFLNGAKLRTIAATMPQSKGRFIWDYVQWQGVPEQIAEKVEEIYRTLRTTFDDHVSLLSASLCLAFLSQGAFSAFVDPYRRKTKFVDIAAGLLMAQEAGFTVHRKSLSNVAEEIVVARPELLDEVLAIVHGPEARANCRPS